MQEHNQHVSPIKNWKQLVVVVVLAFAVPIAVAVIISQWVTGSMRGGNEPDTDVINRIRPIGSVELASTGPKAMKTGEEVYGQVCRNCHENGIAGAPKFGDKAAWGKVIKQGQAVVVSHAENGVRAMPPKGGNPDLDNVEVERAVVYMANRGGANWKEPVVAAAGAAKGGPDRTGAEVVAATCGNCHTNGTNGAPKIGDRAAWRERAKNGYDKVLQSALRGHAGMPARGGMAELSDVEIKRAVEYMMNSGADAPIVPAAQAPAAAPAAAETTAAAHDHASHTAVATPAAAAPASAGAAEGKKIYESTCVVCHGAGIAGAPKFGDKAQWAPRIAQGINVLFAHAKSGFNAMPPKGGNNSLTDAQLRAAIDYMVAAAK
jgi:cytochrome c5